MVDDIETERCCADDDDDVGAEFAATDVGRGGKVADDGSGTG